MVDRAVSEFGHLDWAVNNAGASARGAFLEIPLETFDRAVAVNLRGVMLAMRAEIAAGIVCLLADATFSTAITLSADGGQCAA